jgi:IS4 transposase
VLANWLKPFAKPYSVNLYGRKRTVVARDLVVMLKTLKCAVRVVFIYRRTQWVALYSTDPTFCVTKVIEYYGARWKIESAFKELKQDIGSAESQTRHPNAVSNHLHFCMMAASVAWIYASRLEKTPSRRHAVNGRNHFAFSDVRRSVAKAALDKNFRMLCGESRISLPNSIVTALMRLAA